ncbi:phage tail protein, partial [Escherichia coli]
MNRSDSPKKQPKPFGVNGQRGGILPTTPAGDNSASYEQGFPPITMILKSAGGLPPKGQDMNQILYELSALGRWSSTGALNTFDSEFASEISGYPSGAMLISDDGERIFINTTEGNLSDPNSNGAGWKDVLSYLGLGETINKASGAMQKSANGSDISDVSAFRNALQLGTAATRDVG